MKQELINDNFPKVISMIENGLNIFEALDKLGINRSTFYRGITETQKAELQMTKTANAEFGVSWQNRK
jgi:DNA-directed RNA polymerase subunit N (RpoN/RPB10)